MRHEMAKTHSSKWKNDHECKISWEFKSKSELNLTIITYINIVRTKALLIIIFSPVKSGAFHALAT